MPPVPSSSYSSSASSASTAAAVIKPIAPNPAFSSNAVGANSNANSNANTHANNNTNTQTNIQPNGTTPPPFTFDPQEDDYDDDDGWLDMPIIREDTSLSGLDEEDQKKYHYQHRASSGFGGGDSVSPGSTGSSTSPSTSNPTGTSTGNSSGARTSLTSGGNATGTLIDIDESGSSWRSKLDRGDESTYTRLRAIEEDDLESDEVHMRTKYLFDEDKAMTPLSQMQATKGLLTEAQRIAYVGVCALMCGEMVGGLRGDDGGGKGGKTKKEKEKEKEMKGAVGSMELWALKIMGRLYYHMELETQEQKMIESLADHGVLPSDLVPALMTTHTVANPEYDPEEAAREEEDASDEDSISISDQTLFDEPTTPTPSPSQPQTPPKILPTASLPPSSLPGTQTPLTTQSLSRTSPTLTLDIRWTILCDLFLILIADSVYDARSRVLLEHIAYKLGLGWLDVVRFEKRVSEALEIQEDVETLRNEGVVEDVRKRGRGRRYVMLGLATLGGGLVIGLSAGLLAPVIGLGLAGALTTVGVTGTGAFLGGTAGAAVITTGGVLTGSGIAVRGMVKRTQQVRTFDILPLHNNKRVNCILTVPGFMNGLNDDVRLPFSVLDPIVGDVFSILWEPEMIRETGSALQILTGEVLSQIGMTVLQATVMTGLMSALQWPIILTKLGYLIDNPWSNALDRAKAAGKVLADVLAKRHMGVRPITLVGFSLGARVIFYALVELAAMRAYGIVQDVFLLGATLTVSTSLWLETRSVVSGRYVNAFARNDWVLNYLFRATSGGVGTVAGLRPIMGVRGLENVDVTDKIAGHMSYRTFMPLILDQLGFPVFADYFDEPEEPDFDGERIVVRDEAEQKKSSGWFSRKNKDQPPPNPHPQSTKHVVRPPGGSVSGFVPYKRKVVEGDEGEGDVVTLNGDGDVDGGDKEKEKKGEDDDDDEDLPPRLEHGKSTVNGLSTHSKEHSNSASKVPLHAGFDLGAIKSVLKEVEGAGGAGGGTVGAGGSTPISIPTSTPTPKPSTSKPSTSSLASGTASVLVPPSTLGKTGPGSAPSTPTPATKKKGFFARLSSPSRPRAPAPGSSSNAPGPGSVGSSSVANTATTMTSGSTMSSGLTISTPTPPNRSHSTPPTQVWDTQDTDGVRRSLDFYMTTGVGGGAGGAAGGGGGQYVDAPEMGVDERGLRTTGGMGMGMGVGYGSTAGFGGVGGYDVNEGFGGGSIPTYSRSMSSFARLEDSGLSGASPSGMHSAFLSSLPDDIVPSWGPSSSSSSSSSSMNVTTPTTAKPFSSTFPSTSSSSSSTSTSTSTTDYPSSFSYSSSSGIGIGSGTTPAPAPFSNPFTSATHDRTPVLRFGGTTGDEEEDIGSLISASSSASSNKALNSNSMAWDLPPLQRKKTVDANGIGANPWS